MELVQDSIGRTLRVSLDYGTKRIFVIHITETRANKVLATLTAKQGLKLAAILTNHVRHIIDPDYGSDH